MSILSTKCDIRVGKIKYKNQFYNSYITSMIRRSINSKQGRNDSKRQKSQ